VSLKWVGQVQSRWAEGSTRSAPWKIDRAKGGAEGLVDRQCSVRKPRQRQVISAGEPAQRRSRSTQLACWLPIAVMETSAFQEIDLFLVDANPILHHRIELLDGENDLLEP
jgi:hypothetical protein